MTFGLVHRHSTATERFGWPGDQTVAHINVFGLPAGSGLARLTRAGVSAGEAGTLGFYAGDKFSSGRWTFNVGLRFDRQHARNRPSSTGANGLSPDRLPPLEYAGGPRLTWNVLSPRVGATYRLAERTIVRASYGRFGSQLHWASTAALENPAGISLIEYLFNDTNGDHLAQESELVRATGFVVNVNPANPSAAFSPNQVDPGLVSPTIQSIVGGLEHELRPNFLVGISAGYGRATHVCGTRSSA